MKKAPMAFSEFSYQSKCSRMHKLLCDTNVEIKDRVRWDDEALWSFTPLDVGDDLCDELLKIEGITPNSVITDCMSSVGGNTIAFARRFKHVNAVELDIHRAGMLKHNLKLFDISNVTVHSGDYQDHMYNLTQDILYFDPPWGGNDYKDFAMGTLRINISGVTIEDLICRMHTRARVCMVKLPLNYDFEYFEKAILDVGTIVNTLCYPKPNSMIAKIILFNQN